MARNRAETPPSSVRDNYYPFFAAILRSDDPGEGPNERERAILRIPPRPSLEPPPIPAGTFNSDEPLPYLARFRPGWFRCVLAQSFSQLYLPAATIRKLERKSQGPGKNLGLGRRSKNHCFADVVSINVRGQARVGGFSQSAWMIS